METWWEGISPLNKVFVCSAVVFTLLFIWQLIMTIWGVDSHGGGHPGDTDIHSGLEAPIHYEVHDLGGDAFTLISSRSILAFGTLFSWSGALYLAEGTPILPTLFYSLIWGTLAMLGVSLILHFMLRMQEQGNASAWWALGEQGTVYINIPADGTGKVRLMVRGMMSIVNARSQNGTPIIEGTRVKVVNIVNQNTVEIVEL
jgi:hypothetical protein